MIEGSYEMAAAHSKGRKAEAPKGLAAMAKMPKAVEVPDGDFDDDIPF